jgi:hypothetical protein
MKQPNRWLRQVNLRRSLVTPPPHTATSLMVGALRHVVPRAHERKARSRSLFDITQRSTAMRRLISAFDGSGRGHNGDHHPHPIDGIAAQKHHRPLPDGGRKLAPPHLAAPHLPLLQRQDSGRKAGGCPRPGRVLWFSVITIHVLPIKSVSVQSFEPQPACIPDKLASFGHHATLLTPRRTDGRRLRRRGPRGPPAPGTS